jgi:hypothetical protein
MLRTEAADALRDRRTEDDYLLPAYGERCFAQVPATVADLLGVGDVPGQPLPDDVFEGVRTDAPVVVHVLVDGFGFEQWARHRHAARFLDRFTGTARVSPLTSVYPSETAAALTSVHTGHPPAGHGLLGWDQYLPNRDLLVQPLPFATPDGTPADDLGVDPRELVDEAATPVYDRFPEAGVHAATVVPDDIRGSAYSRLTTGAATATGYDGLTGGGGLDRRLRAAVERAHERGPAYVYAYLPHVDAAAHEHGTRSEQCGATVGEVFRALGRVVTGLDGAAASETLLLVTADHGLLDTDPARNVDLLRDDRIGAAVGRDRRGEPLFCGGPRNLHLVGDGDGAVATLRDALADHGFDRLASEPDRPLDRALFGPDPSATFEARRGDLLVVPSDRAVWHGRSDSLDHLAAHGGLHPDEMVVPFAAARVDRLQESGVGML